MSYQRMESGAVPGYTDRAVGPITLYHFNGTGEATRACNRIERDAQLNALIEERNTLIEQIDAQMADKLLLFLQDQIKPFKTHSHKIWISYSMGSTAVRVEDEYISDYPGGSPLVDILQEMGQMLDGCPLAPYLEDKRLNP